MALRVLTVEFNSGAPVPKLYITLTDAENGKEVGSLVGSQEGEAVFEGLREGKTYIVSATTLKNNAAGKGYTTVEQFTYDSTKPYHLLRTYSVRDYQKLSVPVVMQQPELPHGCEITSLTALLNYYGVNVTKMEMAQNYLPTKPLKTVGEKVYGADPNVAYTGDPENIKTGTYVFAAPIVKAAKQAITAQKADLRVINVSEKSQQDILQFVKDGIPVVVWVTLDLTEPRTKGGWFIEGTKNYHAMYQNLHAVVLTGSLGDNVVAMDPLKGYVTYNAAQFFKSYQELGSQAVAVYK